MKKIKLLLIEDNRLLRDGLTIMLKKQEDMNVVKTVGNGENISNIIQTYKPEVVLLDLSLRNQSSLNFVKLIKQNFQNTKIIVMDLIPLQADVFEFVQAGVSGFILKDATVNDFLKTIRSVADGFKVLPPDLTGSLFSQVVEQALSNSNTSVIMDSIRMTRRERQVIELISDGYSNKEIAQKLNLSAYTVKSHVHNILEKLALSTRVQIAKFAHDSRKVKSAADNNSSFND
jgi:DNA-binding NarL/FixJ family response regulator